jgi:hypothetical protein
LEDTVVAGTVVFRGDVAIFLDPFNEDMKIVEGALVKGVGVVPCLKGVIGLQSSRSGSGGSLSEVLVLSGHGCWRQGTYFVKGVKKGPGFEEDLELLVEIAENA